jgi:hypothetical protein
MIIKSFFDLEGEITRQVLASSSRIQKALSFAVSVALVQQLMGFGIPFL